MTRNERVFHYQNLLLLGYIPFAVVGINMLLERYPLPEANPRKCDVIHENIDYHRRCAQYSEDWREVGSLSH